jgi:hypothetical protein
MSEIRGYKRFLKTMVVNALRRVFDDEYPNPDFRGVNVSIEFPVAKEGYPAVWVGFDDDAPLAIAGIGHVERHPDGLGGWKEGRRWRFEGYLSFTTIALTSQERDGLYDELVSVIAFGQQSVVTKQFRQYVEVDNDLIAANISFDTIEPKGEVAPPGTPWGTDELMYECGMSLRVIGEFVSDDFDGTLVALSSIKVVEADPIFADASGDFPPVVPPDGSDGWL